ncbi:hypothetical protein [Mucilaginibacter xinganensis]|uniref:Uncharacterized protein n=1 Tax=Mucilaginibacter xinganensis TaxID=1234841 RepID=A0A223P137_9SPHI|nr:hypothetical protein [Mucilaginibacter xinganensis]ASU35654.1 hypothetical protein MuYL_3769 [Mucilaginibacter xinganensis]
MKGYVNIPGSIYCRLCRECGARPIIARVSDIGYVVKCSNNDNHYQTMPGLIDIEDWNNHNTITAAPIDFNIKSRLAW